MDTKKQSTSWITSIITHVAVAVIVFMLMRSCTGDSSGTPTTPLTTIEYREVVRVDTLVKTDTLTREVFVSLPGPTAYVTLPDSTKEYTDSTEIDNIKVTYIANIANDSLRGIKFAIEYPEVNIITLINKDVLREKTIRKVSLHAVVAGGINVITYAPVIETGLELETKTNWRIRLTAEWGYPTNIMVKLGLAVPLTR